MNVILVVIDALRADRLGCYGYELKTSPNIDEFAKRSVKFENHFSCANCTDPSVTTILSGRHPIHHGVLSHGPDFVRKNRLSIERTGTDLLTTKLNDYGYKTGIADYLGELWGEKIGERPWQAKLRSRIGRKLENTSLYSLATKAYGKLFGTPRSGISSEMTYKRARDFLKATNGKFFLFIHDWSTHAPYEFPSEHFRRFHCNEENSDVSLKSLGNDLTIEKVRNLLGIKTLGEARAAYDTSIFNADDQFGHFIDFLENKGLLDNTIFILTSDHGEDLGIHHSSYFSHQSLYDSVLHVSLIIYHPDFTSGIIEDLTSHLDIAPTIMDFLDFKPRGMDGFSLRPLMEGQKRGREEVLAAVKSARALRTRKYKLIRILEPERLNWYKDEIELYNIVKDPTEKKNIKDSKPSIVDELSARLKNLERKFKTKREKSIIRSGLR